MLNRIAQVESGAAAPSSKPKTDDWSDCGPNIDPDIAVEGCTKIITGGRDTDENLAGAYHNRGVAYRNKGDYDHAISDFDQALRLNPDLALAYFGRGVTYVDKGKLERGLFDLRIAARRISDNNRLHQEAQRLIDEIEKKLASNPGVAPAPPPPPPEWRTPESAPSPGPEEPRRRRFSIDGGAVIDVEPREIDGQKVTFISVQGDFRPGDEKSFKQAVLTADGPAIVSLKSRGGDLNAGMEIGRTIWTNQLPTVVKDGLCASACALAWLAGRPRYVTPDAQIGFHSPTRVDDPDREADSVGSAFVGGYLTELGFTQPAIAYMTEPQPDEMRWLTSQEARRFGIYVEEWRW